MTHLPLVDSKALAQVIDHFAGSFSDSQKGFLKSRWLHQVRYWDNRSRDARRKYFALRGITVLGSVTIPVLTSLGLVTSPRTTFAIAAAIIAAVVAASATWEGVANYGQIWLEKRRAAELLKVEGWLFFASADKYADMAPETAFPTFAAEVERQIAKEVGEYVSAFDPSQATKRASQFVDLLKAVGVKLPNT
jgi:Protein of unknown function (DUF4231)